MKNIALGADTTIQSYIHPILKIHPTLTLPSKGGNSELHGTKVPL